MFTSQKIIESLFPGALLIKPVQAGALLGQSRQSTYNQVSAGRFPVQMVIDHLGRKMVRLADLAAYLDSLQVVPTKPVEPTKTQLPQGRPPKSIQVAARKLGITVPQFYAQKAVL